MKDKSEIFISKLNQGPAVLFLGQGYLRLESGKDSFLSEINRKYDSEGSNKSYDEIFGGSAKNNTEASLAWMQERSEKLGLPQWLKTVSKFPWSHLYTSSIDVVWMRLLRTEWRQVQPIYDEKYRPIDPRNRSKLHCTILFGSVNQSDPSARPPLSKLEWLRRKQIAVALARRLPEIVTPFGILAIEGYDFNSDWFSFEEFYPILESMGDGQVHIFSVKDDEPKNDLLQALEQSGKVILHRESLAQLLLRAEESGEINLDFQTEENGVGHFISAGEKRVSVPLTLWNQISRAALVINDSLFIKEPVSEENHYSLFRGFLAESNVHPVWNGYERGFAFRRKFEVALRSEIERAFKLNTILDEPIILHGQTGTGKTIALGQLAYEIYKQRRFPVLFIEKKSQRPYPPDIDAFCNWAEDVGSPLTLIIWDGMLDEDSYYELVQYLGGRGRKTVIVGSTYKSQNSRRNYVEAPADLSLEEIEELSTFLNRFDQNLGQSLKSIMSRHPETFLVALYRLLPATRGQLRVGVSMEVGQTEQEIQRKAQEFLVEPSTTTLGYALLRAGLISKEKFLKPEQRDLGGEEVNEVQMLVGLIMVPGKFGLQVPIELLMRVLKSDSNIDLVNLLKEYDIFRWHEDEAGNVSLGPRHSLEASLYIKARLGGPRSEIGFAKELLLQLKGQDSFADTPEIQFAVDFVRSMGPNEQDETYFAPYFRDLAAILSELRESRGVQNPRLMLQEANLLRESVVQASRASSLVAGEAEHSLDQAESILRSALQILEGDRRNKKLMSRISVELASTMGSRVYYVLNDSDHRNDALQLFQSAREQLFRSRTLDPENYYFIDVLAWTTKDIMRSGLLSPVARAEVEADILNVFEMVEAEDFSALQRERFRVRQLEIGDLLRNQDLSEEAFAELEKLGSGAGYYLRALSIVQEIPANRELTEEEKGRCLMAAEYLQSNRKVIEVDGRCMYMLLRLWWMGISGKPLFYGERQTVPFRQQDWVFASQIISQLQILDTRFSTASLKYLLGICSFHLNEIEGSLQLFRELERESDYQQGRRRIIRSYLVSTPAGLPRTFNGIVAWVNSDGKGEVFVEELRRNIRFSAIEFNNPAIRKNDALTSFHIGFNFVGPIAGPPTYVRSQAEGAR